MERWTIYLGAVILCASAGLTASDGPQSGQPNCAPTVDSACEINEKVASMESFRARTEDGDILTTNQGLKISDDSNSLKAGVRGSTLLEDFILREKITHFDHERIPERVVHARGAGAYGFFQVYNSLANITKAKFLQDPKKKTPVFVRFSTVGGFRGSADTVRDVRGFATKFYTEDGNFDIVGNNMPIFFIQDAIKFPDLIHSVKPEPHNEIPQAQSGHDNFYDFITQQPEAAHMLMWVNSDRGIPRSYANMEGFGIHTFRLINEQGVSRFVKFHWKPYLGVHSLTADDAGKLVGKDPDFHRRQLWESIASGAFPEWELGLQIVEAEDEFKFDFDILDPTKLIPEELVPVIRVGRLVLNRNPDNYFAETEQVAFCIANIVPGIDFSDDPLMQGRIFSYLDTQITRLGGPNFQEIPINRPVCPFLKNNQRDGLHRDTINVGQTNYHKNTLNAGLPKEATPAAGFQGFPERIAANIVRARSPSFDDHFSQAILFWTSLSSWEQDHLVDSFTGEMAHCQPAIRERLVRLLLNINESLSNRVALNVGVKIDPMPYHTAPPKPVTPSPALSQRNQSKDTILTRVVAVLVADGVNGQAVAQFKNAIIAAGGNVSIIAPRFGTVTPAEADGALIPVNGTFGTFPSVLFDAVFIPGGASSVALLGKIGAAVHYVQEAFVNLKPIAAAGEGVELLKQVGWTPQDAKPPAGVVINDGNAISNAFTAAFVEAIKQHRFYEREKTSSVPS
ncbi:Catalase HPII [Hypsibius exemplaris]|uniref:Catalase n=1 Tax=Hypsibius exemplaris TaxID=2072580 RepID=A0A9X6RKD2_HYPEX|nr:Catalase HPII [Hypsibius exemplaris]